MGKLAFLYAGQGSQQTGMGQEFYQTCPEFREVFNRVQLDFDLKETCFDNPDNRLKDTRFTQPAMVAYACGVTELLKRRDIQPDLVGGLSLGEYSALYAAGVWTLEDTMKIISCRANAMADASEGIASAMIAVTGLCQTELEACCEKAASVGMVSLCNLNCPGQIVIGGEKAAVEEAARLAREAGARRCIPLPVSGPFHTVLMKPAANALKSFFETVRFKTPGVEIVYNVLGGPNTDGEPIQDLLVRQVMSPVKMQACLEYMLRAGVDSFIEIGPGNTLQGLVRKLANEKGIPLDAIRIVSINSPCDVSAVEELRN